MKKEKYIFLEKSKLEKIKNDFFTPYSLPFEKNWIEENENKSILSTGPNCLRR